MKITKKVAEKLLSLNDEDLAKTINRWGTYDPEIFVIDIDARGRRTCHTKTAPDWIKKILNSCPWPSVKNVEALLKELDVTECKKGPWHNYRDGDCDIIFKHSPSGQRYNLRSNYYYDTCYVEVVRWALKIFTETPKE